MSIMEGITGEVEGSSLRWDDKSPKGYTEWHHLGKILNIFASECILDGLAQVACGESGKKWLDSGYNFKVGQATCNDGLEVLLEK